MKRTKQMRLQMIWRLAAADFHYGLDADLTAENLGLTPAFADHVRRTEPYKQFFSTFRESEANTLKRQMGEDAEKIRSAMLAMVPKAMMVLESALEDPDTAMKAAVEVLDRSGILPKTSRVQTQQEQNVIPDVEESIVKEFHKTVN